MTDNKIILSFDKALTNLAGYDFGVSEYEKQVQGKIDTSTEFVIVFPEQIKGIAASFVQGFFSDIVKNIGLLSTERYAKIEAGNERLAKSVIAKLL